jgi:putative protease
LLPQLERGPVRTVVAEPTIARVRAACAVPPLPNAPAALVPLVRSEEQLLAVIGEGCREVELDWMEFTGLGTRFERARAAGVTVTIATTRVGKPGEEALVERIRKLAPDGILVRHFGP